jgi:protein TonB
MPSFTMPVGRSSFSAALPSTTFHVALLIAAIWGTRASAIAISQHSTEIPIDWVVTRTSHPVSSTERVMIPVAPLVEESIIPKIDLSGVPPIIPGHPKVFPPSSTPSKWTAIPGIAGNDTGSTTQVFPESEVDDLPSLITSGRLRYPPVLAEAGVEGSVTLTFVIDAEGTVDPSAIEILSATHPGFIEAAREAVSTSRFRPARRHGAAVRVRVRQTVTFHK